ncbi:sigma-70 family RNA polymerase sigma factor [Sphingobium cloacae]|uniref:ECF family RNA polymerase sigma factor n=1 Tax=Sphingobium cloacae TaxID=120107 RepID=A0A1E1EYU5_9SPHN|nr:sigma-70 family RNA polymerase sigma factor [Sphingobium cloacae]BAV63382.1 ECF family RNA polymerase sigma factor [Sphingobium cloacae]
MRHDARKLEIWHAHRATLVESATALVGDRGNAEDIVQEAWLRFNRPPDQERSRLVTHPVGYLYRIVRNLAIDFLRKQRTSETIEAPGDPDAETVASPLPSPEQHALDRDELRAVETALSALPERTRTIFELYNYHGVTMQDIAARMHISVGLVHLLIKQAVTHCANAISDDEA